MIEWLTGYGKVITQNVFEIVVTLIIGMVIGCAIGYFLNTAIRNGVNALVRKLDNAVLVFSLFVAIICMFSALVFKEEQVSIQILSFYSSFVFAWLLTKKSAKEEFKKTQHKVAKNTYRHIENVETAAIITRDRLCEFQKKLEGCEEQTIDIDGLIDNVDVILTGIRSNKKDWEDMLKKSYREKIRQEEDPEAKLAHMRNKNEIKPPEKEVLKITFGDAEIKRSQSK